MARPSLKTSSGWGTRSDKNNTIGAKLVLPDQHGGRKVPVDPIKWDRKIGSWGPSGSLPGRTGIQVGSHRKEAELAKEHS